MPKADFVTAIGLTLFGSAVLVRSLQMPRFENLGVNPYSVPGIVPGLLGLILMILGLVLLVRSIRQRGYRFGLNSMVVKEYFSEDSTRRFLISFFLCVVYGVFVLRRLAYPLATGLFVFSFIFIFEFRRQESLASQTRTLLTALLEAILVSGGVTLVFRYLFLVDLP
ncbi:MAG TPA: tripartite tricarboxylate transporter TctB family protein [Thermodesulfobacteriota bacterium]|nr:tripartite tricarboxylate transporter TctB family protein [Thermodesulfobacteriota bacterium]